MVYYCCVKGCNNNSNSSKKDPGAISFHAFPSNPELRRKWLRAIGRPAWNPSSHVRICSAHFSSDKINKDGYRTRMKEDAVPVNSLPLNSNFEASNIEVCRICLATDVKMVSLEKGVLKNCMETITSFNDNKCIIEGLPQYVCYECTACLLKFHKLIEKSLVAQTTLLDIFAQNSQITKNLIRKQNRKLLNLQSTLSINHLMPCHFYNYIYDEEDNISCLMNQFVSSDVVHQSDVQHNETIIRKSKTVMKKTENLILKCEVHETDLKVDKDFSSNDDNDVAMSDGENGILNSPLSYDENSKCESNKDVDMKEETSSVGEEKNNLLETLENKLKRSKSLDGCTPDEVEMGKYFRIIKLSEEEQIKEWKKVVTQSNFTTKTVFECNVCSKLFASRTALESHTTFHDPKRGASECRVCKHRFKTDVLAKSHAKRTHGKKFECKTCNKVFSNVSVAKKHHLWHAGHRYSCARCAFSTLHASSCALHARQHAPQHACARCGRAFISRRGLALHASTAHGGHENEPSNTKFRCKECGINFASEGARRVHVLTSKQHHKNSQNTPSALLDPSLKTTCKRCGVQFSTSKELVEHLKTEHRRPVKKTSWNMPGDSYPTQCEHCGYSVNNRNEHWTHVRREHQTLRHQYRAVINAVCDTCGKGFQNVTKLRIHELSHGSPTYPCSTCERMFHNKHALKRHAVVHKPREHACNVCGRAFALKGNLTRHERVHTGVTPYECNLCNKRFRHSSSVRLHIRTVHHNLPHPPRAPRVAKNYD